MDFAYTLMARSTKILVDRLLVGISLLLLLIALILGLISLFGIGHYSLSDAAAIGSLVLSELLKLVVLFLIFVLLLATYGLIWKRLRWTKLKPKDAIILLSIVQIVLGLILLGDFVLASGIVLLVVWIIMII